MQSKPKTETELKTLLSLPLSPDELHFFTLQTNVIDFYGLH